MRIPAFIALLLLGLFVAPSASQAAALNVSGSTVTLTVGPGEGGGDWYLSTNLSIEDGTQFLNLSQRRTSFPVTVTGCTPLPAATAEQPSCNVPVPTSIVLNGSPLSERLGVLPNPGASVSIVGGGGDDKLDPSGPNMSSSAPVAQRAAAAISVVGGDGTDTIEVGPALVTTIVSGGGNDTIRAEGVNGSAIGVDGGPGDDAITVSNLFEATAPMGPTSIVGGDGNDAIVFSGGVGSRATIAAGAGNDDINTLLGPATIDAGVGDDVIEPDTNRVPPLSGGLPAAPVGPDVIAGGPGVDTLKADRSVGRTQPFIATLDGVADDGQVGEGDNYAADLENVTGGGFVAKITGTAANNVLSGGGPGARIVGLGGNDTLSDGVGSTATAGRPTSLDGGAGKDALTASSFAVLIGGAGRDALTGGVTSDRFESRDGERDTINCGGGPDIAVIDPKDVVPADAASKCEKVRRAAVATLSGSSTRLRVRGGVVSVKLRCAPGRACRGSVRLRTPGDASRPIGSVSYSLKAGKSKTVRLKPSSKGRKIIREQKQQPAVLELRSPGATAPTAERAVTLRR